MQHVQGLLDRRPLQVDDEWLTPTAFNAAASASISSLMPVNICLPPSGNSRGFQVGRHEEHIGDVDRGRVAARFSAALCIRSMPVFSRPGVFIRNSRCSTPDTRRRRTARRGGVKVRSRRRPRSADAASTGLRLEHHVVECAYLPCMSGRSWVHNAFQAWMYSSVTAPRSRERRRTQGGEFLLHPAGADAGDQRPLERTSTVWNSLAASTAGRCGTTTRRSAA